MERLVLFMLDLVYISVEFLEQLIAQDDTRNLFRLTYAGPKLVL